MALFQCILEGGRMGHATVNPKLKDEKDKKKKNPIKTNKEKEGKKVYFFFASWISSSEIKRNKLGMYSQGKDWLRGWMV